MLSDPLTLRGSASNTPVVYSLVALGPGSKTIRAVNGTHEYSEVMKDEVTISHDTLKTGRTRSLFRFDFTITTLSSLGTEDVAAYLVVDRPAKGLISDTIVESLVNARMRSLFDGDTSEAFGTVLTETQKFLNGEP
jgi:hypothetical protein